MLLKILDDNKNYHDNWSVSSAVLSVSSAILSVSSAEISVSSAVLSVSSAVLSVSSAILSVSSAVLSVSLSTRCGLPSGYDGGDFNQMWRVAGNILNKK
jgi:hypothetical protein